MTGKRPHSGETVDDLGPVDGEARKHMPDEVDEVVDLVVGAHDRIGHVVLEVGRADEHPALERVDEDDPSVLVLEEQLATARRREQLGVVEHDVRALRAAHEAVGSPRAAFVESVHGPEALMTTDAANGVSSPVSGSRSTTRPPSAPTAAV